MYGAKIVWSCFCFSTVMVLILMGIPFNPWLHILCSDEWASMCASDPNYKCKVGPSYTTMSNFKPDECKYTVCYVYDPTTTIQTFIGVELYHGIYCEQSIGYMIGWIFCLVVLLFMIFWICFLFGTMLH